MVEFSRLNMNVISDEGRILGKSEVEDMVKSGSHEIFTVDSLQAFVKGCNDTIKKGQSVGVDQSEFDSVGEAMKEFRSLTKAIMLNELGQKVPVYIREKNVEEDK